MQTHDQEEDIISDKPHKKQKHHHRRNTAVGASTNVSSDLLGTQLVTNLSAINSSVESHPTFSRIPRSALSQQEQEPAKKIQHLETHYLERGVV
jgi:hypothetical protein